MSRKRPADDNEGGREFKKQRATPHRGKWDAVVQDFLELLNPASGESLADFNNVEREEKRRGLIPIDILLVEMELEELPATNDIEPKLEWIGSHLKDAQEVYESYLETHGAVAEVRLTVGNIIWCIQKARDRLPGMFSHLDELLRKLNITIHRS
jgi:hypothetical protein